MCAICIYEGLLFLRLCCRSSLSLLLCVCTERFKLGCCARWTSGEAMRSSLFIALSLASRGGHAFFPGSLHVSTSGGFLHTRCRSGSGAVACAGRSWPTSGPNPFRMATDGPPSSSSKNLGSYYRRPSAAIEQGGGFFVPGLQGYRLRFVLAAVILGLLSLDGFSRPGMSTSQVVSEALAALAGVALFIQAFLDQQKEQAVQMRREAIASASEKQAGEEDTSAGEREVSFFDSAAMGRDLEERLRWAAGILLQLTAGCSFVAFSDGNVLARVGSTGGESNDADLLAVTIKRAATAAAAATTAGGGGPSTIVARAMQGKEIGGIDANPSVAQNDDEAIMQLLPSSCRQGILCWVSPLHGGGVSGGNGEVAVLLGSTLSGAGVFSGMDGAWFERVCANLALAAAGDSTKR